KTVHGAISEALGEEIGPGTELPELLRLCDRAGVPYTDDDTPGDVVLEMYERLVEEKTQLPTFYKDFPTEVSPLTREHRTDPRLAERWDLVAFGTELGTAYSELTDPVEQRRRLTAQSLLAAGGDPEAMELDEDFLDALEYAMPPTGGLGIGVDRLGMVLTGLTSRETLPCPLVRRRCPAPARTAGTRPPGHWAKRVESCRHTGVAAERRAPAGRLMTHEEGSVAHPAPGVDHRRRRSGSGRRGGPVHDVHREQGRTAPRPARRRSPGRPPAPALRVPPPAPDRLRHPARRARPAPGAQRTAAAGVRPRPHHGADLRRRPRPPLHPRHPGHARRVRRARHVLRVRRD